MIFVLVSEYREKKSIMKIDRSFVLREIAGEYITEAVQSCLEPHMFPVEILAIDERPFFHFKTNRIELSQELKQKKFNC